MRARLIPRAGVTAAVVTACLAAVGLLAAQVHDATRAGSFDVAVQHWIRSEIATHWIDAGLWLSDPAPVVAVLAALAVAAALRRRWDVAALTLTAPALTVLLTELVLKPLVHRATVQATPPGEPAMYSFPSGHESGLAAACAVLAVVLLGRRLALAWKLAALALMALVCVVGAGALVGALYHWPTDTVGAACLAVAVTCAAAFAIDAAARAAARRRAGRAPGAGAAVGGVPPGVPSRRG